MVSQGTLSPELNQQVDSHLAVGAGATGASSAAQSLSLPSQDATSHSGRPALVWVLRHPVL